MNKKLLEIIANQSRLLAEVKEEIMERTQIEEEDMKGEECDGGRVKRGNRILER